MLLRQYRKQIMRRTLERAAPMLGLSRGALGDIENGRFLPAIDKVLVIEGATGGRVSLLDHYAAWQRANIEKASQLRDRGRALAKTTKSPAKRK